MISADQYERYMLQLINAERAIVGAPALRLERNLNQAARDHSLWMLRTDEFSHTGQGNSSPTQRMARADFDFAGSWRSAENIAVQSERGPSGIRDDVRDLHISLMNSPGHRANILNPDLDYIGIGIELGDFDFGTGEYRSVIVTQNFASTQGSVDLDGGNPQSPAPTPPPPVPTPAPQAPPQGAVASQQDDDIRGTGRADTINGRGGNDVIDGKGGNDRIFGGAGDDDLKGGSGNDQLKGNSGDDRLDGGSGADRLWGGSDRDLLMGGSGSDTLFGESGDDMLVGGYGNDRLDGGSGRDTLNGGGGQDVMRGGSGADLFIYRAGDKRDRIVDFENNRDTLDLSDFGFANAAAALSRAEQAGRNLEFDLGGGNVLTVTGITADQIADDLLV